MTENGLVDYFVISHISKWIAALIVSARNDGKGYYCFISFNDALFAIERINYFAMSCSHSSQ
jgi:hypothetical protein